LGLTDAAGKTRAVLDVKAEGSALALYDTAEELRALLGVAQPGESPKASAAGVTLLGQDGKVIWRAP